MSEMQHTKGPWRVEHTIYEHMAAEIVASKPGRGRGLAQVWSGPNAMADAAMMAASLEMYEAAVALVDRNVTYEGSRIIIECESHGDAIGKVAKIRAALRKAEGKP